MEVGAPCFLYPERAAVLCSILEPESGLLQVSLRHEVSWNWSAGGASPLREHNRAFR